MNQAIAHVLARNLHENGLRKESINEIAPKLREYYYEMLVEPCGQVREFYEAHADSYRRIRTLTDPSEFKWSKVGPIGRVLWLASIGNAIIR